MNQITFIVVFLSAVMVTIIVRDKHLKFEERSFPICAFVMIGTGQVLTSFGVDSDNFFIVWIVVSVFTVMRLNNLLRHRYNQVISILAAVLVALGLVFFFWQDSASLCYLSPLVGLIMLYLHRQLISKDVDNLTGLLNYGAWHSYVQDLRRDAVVMMLDLNDLKKINDTYGHQAGNAVIIAMAKVMMEVFHPYGVCFRIGGDEFAVLILKDLDKIDTMTGRMIAELEEMRKREPLLTRVSWGLAHFNRRTGKNIFAVIEDADKQMYEFKAKSKDPQDPR